MNIILTLAVGSREWGDKALNLILSIKSIDHDQKVAVIYTASAIDGLEGYFNEFSDYALCIPYEFETAAELAFYTKTRLYDYAIQMCPDADNFLFLDADTLMIPGRSTKEWFEKHEGKIFTAYCNDQYDYRTKWRARKDYTFWCDVDKAKEYWELSGGTKMPQINSSFLYFAKRGGANAFFRYVKQVWDNTEFPFIPYKGVKPDELCFNIASAITGISPHQTTYRPIFFQFATQNHSIEYILHYFKCFGFAGTEKHGEYIVNLYNQFSAYYRIFFGINDKFVFSDTTGVIEDKNPIDIKPIKRRTIFRSGEVENSDGGCFNPDGIMLDGQLMTIMRKEKNLDVYKGRYQYHTSIPFIYFDENEHYELSLSGFDSRLRVEDFRVFKHKNFLFCNHAIIFKDEPNDRHIVSALSYINLSAKTLSYWHIPKLPIEVGKLEKNWCFFSEGDRIYLVYSLSPYRLFYCDTTAEVPEWKQENVTPVELNWFHHSFICNSTNPVLVDDYYLMLFHSKARQIYFHGMVLINKDTKEIDYYTKNTIPVKSYAQGLHEGLLYVSGCELINKDTIRLFYGESDSHACYNDYDKNTLINAIKQNYAD